MTTRADAPAHQICKVERHPEQPKRFRYKAWAEAEAFERDLLATARTPAERAAVLACTPGFFELRRSYWRARARRKALQGKGQRELEGLSQCVLAMLARLIQRQPGQETAPARQLTEAEIALEALLAAREKAQTPPASPSVRGDSAEDCATVVPTQQNA